MSVSGYVDLQINGYAGIDFNQEQLTLEDLHKACETLENHGVSGVLATIITDSIPTMSARLARVAKLREEDPLIKKMVWGIHIEGPFISQVPGYVGAHPKDQARQTNWNDMAQLLEAAGGLTKIVTIAPEQDPQQETTRKLVAEGVIVSAGHTDASRDELNACIDQGLSMFTHLGNGCPMQMHRHDNIIQRALSRKDALRFGLIADGAHIPFFALKNYLDLIGLDHAFVVTDAISAAGCGPGRYPLGDRYVNVGEDGVPRAEDHSHLVGSGTIMQRMAQNLSREVGLTDDQIDQLIRRNPLAILGL